MTFSVSLERSDSSSVELDAFFSSISVLLHRLQEFQFSLLAGFPVRLQLERLPPLLEYFFQLVYRNRLSFLQPCLQPLELALQACSCLLFYKIITFKPFLFHGRTSFWLDKYASIVADVSVFVNVCLVWILDQYYHQISQ